MPTCLSPSLPPYSIPKPQGHSSLPEPCQKMTGCPLPPSSSSLKGAPSLLQVSQESVLGKYWPGSGCGYSHWTPADREHSIRPSPPAEDLYANPGKGPAPSLGMSQQDLGGAKAGHVHLGPHRGMPRYSQHSGHAFLLETDFGYSPLCPSKTYPCFSTSSPSLHLCSKPIITG